MLITFWLNNGCKHKYSTEFFTFYQFKLIWITSNENQRLIPEKMKRNFQRFEKLGWFHSLGFKLK